MACLLLFGGARLLAAAPETASPPKAELISVRRIWDEGAHNAFTDLIRFRGHWFCAFREATGHVSADGRIRVLHSPDGESWRSAALLVRTDADLRDPGLAADGDRRLLLVAAASWHGDGDPLRRQSMTWESGDGFRWGTGSEVGEPDWWFWKATWQEGRYYGVGYNGYARAQERSVRLYASTDGKRFDVLAPSIFSEGFPNEARLRFRSDGTAVCLLRRDGQPSSGLVGMAAPPYARWEWRDLRVQIGGPNLLQLPDGRWVACVRLYDGGARTTLCSLDPEGGALSEWLTLPSGGDTSYAGMVWHDDLLWLSYYSSHEGKTSVYLARVRLATGGAPEGP